MKTTHYNTPCTFIAFAPAKRGEPITHAIVLIEARHWINRPKAEWMVALRDLVGEMPEEIQLLKGAKDGQANGNIIGIAGHEGQ